MPKRCWWVAFVASACLTAVFANWNDTSTGINLDKLPHPAFKKIRSGRLRVGAHATFNGIDALATANDIRLRGKGTSGKRWEVHVCSSCFIDVWSADLDRNGTEDYVFFGGGPYFNGRMTPLYSLSLLLMDDQNLPVPFMTVIYHGEDGKGSGIGIQHLVDLDRDGHAELLISSYDENVSDARVGAFCSGHWVTQLYRFKNLEVEEVRGTIGGLSFPFVHDWSYRGTQCTEQTTPLFTVEPPRLLEHGTSTKGQVTTTIRGFKNSFRLAVDPAAGCRAIDPSIIVYDRPQVRKIGFPNLMSSYSDELANTISKEGATVKLRGVDKWMGNGDCSANLVWAVR